MNILRKIIAFIMIIIFILMQTGSNHFKTITSLNMNANNNNIVNAGVLLYSFDDLYMSQIKQSLEDIQKTKKGANFTFFNSKDNLAIQNELLDSLFTDNFNLLILYLIKPSKDELTDIVKRAEQRGISLIIADIEPLDISQIASSYDQVAFLTTDSNQLGSLQGSILINEWNTNRSAIDKNNDNIIQYISLEGDPASKVTMDRTNSSISTIENSGIKMQQLDRKTAFWDKELAETTVESLFLKYSNKIEAIISNNDAMAIGAVAALQKYGYNKGDKSKYVSVVGIDGLQEAKDLIDKDMMTGTVAQDFNTIAEALYNVGVSLIYNKTLPENKNYKLIDRKIVITEPYQLYTKK